MKYVLTNEQMRAADEYTITEKGMPSSVLMGGAGNSLAHEVETLQKEGAVLIVCGGGNNGGDGFVCARVLRSGKRTVDVLCVAEKFSHDGEAQKRKWLALGGEILTEIPDKKYAVVVDCLFGTGFHGQIKGKEEKLVLAIRRLQEGGAKVLSADIPSGVNGENGVATGLAVRADTTLCFGELKTGVLLCDGIDLSGEVKRADIGIHLPEKNYARLMDNELANTLLPKRKKNSHKGSYGRAAIVAGSESYTGAALLSARACLKSGAGYTALFLPKSILPYYYLRAPEILLCPSNEGGRYAFNEDAAASLLAYDSIAYGMGMGVSEEVYKGAVWLMENYEGKLLLDADAINSLAAYGDSEPFARKKCSLVLTPHAKEFSRLTGLSTTEIFEGGVALVRKIAQEKDCALLLKGATSIIAEGERVILSNAGNSGQAKGGSGDVLSGIIAALLAQGCDSLSAAALGSYLAGVAAELAVKKTGEYSLTASDIIDTLGESFLFVTENADKERGDEQATAKE